MCVRCLAAAVLLLVPSVASAEDCPEGDWFCDSPPEGSAPAVQTEPSAAEPAKPPATAAPGQAPQHKPREVVVVQNPPPPRPKKRKVRGEWGFNVHLAAALMGDDEEKSRDAEMGGLGFGFRYRPIPMLAFDANLELLGGTDWNGYDRAESALLANCLLYFNPRDRVQVFWFGGFGVSGARVEVESDEENFDERYSYFGVQTGVGIEIRVSKRVAVGADILGFVRGRTDADHNTRPEFVDPETHLTSNASGGGLLRGGATFYW